MGFYKNPLDAQAISFIIFPFPVQRVTKAGFRRTGRLDMIRPLQGPKYNSS